METSTLLIAIGTGACRIARGRLAGKLKSPFRLFWVDRKEETVEEVWQALVSDADIHDKRVVLFSTLGGVSIVYAQCHIKTTCKLYI